MQLHARKTLPMNSAFTPWTIEEDRLLLHTYQSGAKINEIRVGVRSYKSIKHQLRRLQNVTPLVRDAHHKSVCDPRRRRRISTCSTTSGRRSTRPSLYRRARRSTGFAASQRCLPYPVRLHARVIIRLTPTTSEAIPSQTRISSVIHHPIISDPTVPEISSAYVTDLATDGSAELDPDGLPTSSSATDTGLCHISLSQPTWLALVKKQPHAVISCRPPSQRCARAVWVARALLVLKNQQAASRAI